MARLAGVTGGQQSKGGVESRHATGKPETRNSGAVVGAVWPRCADYLGVPDSWISDQPLALLAAHQPQESHARRIAPGRHTPA